MPLSPVAAPRDGIVSFRKVPTSNSPAIPRPENQPPRKETLPRKAVLRGRQRFQGLFDGGRRLGNRILTFLVLPVAPPESGKVAFITPKKLGEAVVRNRLRRQLREIYRRHLPLLASRPPSDLIVLAKSEALKLDFSALERNFLELYAKLAEKVKSS